MDGSYLSSPLSQEILSRLASCGVVSFRVVRSLRGVPADHLVDSAPWLALFRAIATPLPSLDEGARIVYEASGPKIEGALDGRW